MNQIQKTSVFVAAAALLSVVTWATRPSFTTLTPKDMVGQELYPDFTDPLKAASLEIVKYDGTAPTTFKVAQVNGRWSIPSHQNYPADAENQLSEAASGLMHLKVLDLATVPAASAGQKAEGDPGVRAEHEMYGVVDPGAKGLSAGAAGVGTRVVMRDKDDKILSALVIGKQVPGQDALYYVRRVDQDPVYIVKAKTDKLSNKFEDWIEKNLLKISSWDIKKVHIEDYSVDILAGQLNPRGRMTLEYNDTGDPRWKLAEDQAIGRQGWQAKKLAANEELNTTTLDALKTALDDLKIIDVARKPQGLSGDLKATGDIRADAETRDSLAERGFYLVPVVDPSNPGQAGLQLCSNEGEFTVLMKDGVKYVLRFGGVAGSSKKEAGADAKKAGDAKKEPAKTESGDSINRYLFVMAQFDPSVIEKPVLEKLPEETPADVKKDEAKKDEAKTDAKPGDKKADDKQAADKKAADLKAERERIEKANKQKEDEYNDKLKKGEEKVKELNGRFADWYFVISEDVYKKIHLGRKDLVKIKEEKKDEKKPGETAAPAPNTPGELESLKSAVPTATASEPETKAEAPKADAPKAEPKADAPKAESKAETPKAEVSQGDKKADAKGEAAKPAKKTGKAKSAKAKPAKNSEPAKADAKDEKPKGDAPKAEPSKADDAK